MQIRALDELVDLDSTTWTHLTRLIDNTPTQVLDPNLDEAFDTLYRLQVTSDSLMGAIAVNTGAILADHGWFRLLGSGFAPDLPGLADANGLESPSPRTPGHLVIGFDVLGGQFAIDHGALGVNPGDVCYFAPDSLEWEGMGGGYQAFVEAAITGKLAEAFSPLRWEGWIDDIAELPLAMSISCYPPLYSEQGGEVAQATRTPVLTTDLLEIYASAAAQRHTRA